MSPYLLIDHAGSSSGGVLGTQAAIVGGALNAMGSMTGSTGGSGSRVSVGSNVTTTTLNSASTGMTGGTMQQRRSVNDLPAINAAASTALISSSNNTMILGGTGHGFGTTNPVIANAAVATAVGGGASGMAGSDANYILWQAEMEKGYETLVNSISPYISELRETANLVPKSRG